MTGGRTRAGRSFAVPAAVAVPAALTTATPGPEGLVGPSTLRVVGAVLQRPSSVRYVSPDELFVLFLLPLLGGAVVLYVVEDLLGYPEWQSYGATGLALLGLALTLGRALDTGVAYALQREFGWRIGFQVGSPLTIYFGLWAAMLFLTAHEQRQEAAGSDAS